MPDALRQRLKMDVETFDRKPPRSLSRKEPPSSTSQAIFVRTGQHQLWRTGYDAQLAFRRAQIDRMVHFAETQQCRMAALIQHFGDTADGLRPCGHCDFCSPERATAQTFRATHAAGRAPTPRHPLSALQGAPPRATGKLHTDLALGSDRKQFDSLLEALTRAGLIALTTDTFTNPEGQLINFKRASLTHEGRTLSTDEPLTVHLKDLGDSETSRNRNRSSKQKTARTSLRKATSDGLNPRTPEQEELNRRLREWRKAEAAKTGKPAFIVFGDSVLDAIIQANPTTISELLNVPGIGPEKADRYGAAVITLCTGRAVPTEADKPARELVPPQKPPQKPARPQHPISAFVRTRTTDSENEVSLTPEQQALDQRLREWRSSEAERLGLPQFFVLGSSVLRTIVLTRPRTIAELKTISGIAHEKVERFGPAIIEACTA